VDKDAIVRTLHDSVLFEIDFSRWPNGIDMLFWNGQNGYRLHLTAVLQFEYEVSNLGEFALPAIDSYNVEIREDEESVEWDKRLNKTGSTSDTHHAVFHVIISSVMMRIRRYDKTSIGISAFCREYHLNTIENQSIVPEWLRIYGL